MFSEKISKIITYIFNPLIMPTIGMLMIFSSGTYLSYIPIEGKKLILTVVFAGTFLLPLSLLPVFFYLRVIKNIEMNENSRRSIPLLTTSIFYFFTFWIIKRFPVPFINVFIFATALCVVLNLLINLKWKISSHLIGSGGLTGLSTALFLRLNADIVNMLIITLLITGITGFARLKLNAHTPSQVYSGFLLGFATVTFLILVY
jgi:membrane-associated phospholipid phosphatase